ncbi:hypothetical protein ACSBLW_06235 [Thioclava sp. FR2]|uniref:hypothetical protein n=1 Tax=Thioclava sp. FR2 TaxID=3445780 RepID=UPI003EC0E0DF
MSFSPLPRSTPQSDWRPQHFTSNDRFGATAQLWCCIAIRPLSARQNGVDVIGRYNNRTAQDQAVLERRYLPL